jgi:hypothetical protein
MEGKTYSKLEIISILKQLEDGADMKQLIKTYGIDEETFAEWRSRLSEENSEEQTDTAESDAEHVRLHEFLEHLRTLRDKYQ